MDENEFSDVQEAKVADAVRRICDEQADEDTGFYPPSWGELVGAFAGTVLATQRFGSYQGDLAVVLWDGSRTGVALIGYGSCSGCDALYSCGSAEEVVDLAVRTFRSVRWFAAAREADAWLQDQLDGDGHLQWYAHEVGFTDAVDQLRVALAQVA